MRPIVIHPPAQPKAVLLFGEVLVDRFPKRDILGGAPFNVAYHLLGLGRWLRPLLISRIGREAPALAAMFACDSDTPSHLGEQLIHAFDINKLLATKGKQGAWILTSGGYAQTPQTEVSNNLTHVVETVGAGDRFAAVFLLGLILDWPMQLVLDRAHSFAAKICNLRGAIPDSPDFYAPSIVEWHIAGAQQV